jgi:hypothetical protein
VSTTIPVPAIPSLVNRVCSDEPVMRGDVLEWAARRVEVVRFALQHYVNGDGAICNRDLEVVSSGLADLLDDAVGVIEAANAPLTEALAAIEAPKGGAR